MFDPKGSIDFMGNTGPYLQFNYVRSRSVLRNASVKDSTTLKISQSVTLDDTEKALLMTVLSLPDVIKEAAKLYDPSLVANLCYDITKSYSSWYQDHPILRRKTKSFAMHVLLSALLAVQL